MLKYCSMSTRENARWHLCNQKRCLTCDTPKTQCNSKRRCVICREALRALRVIAGTESYDVRNIPETKSTTTNTVRSGGWIKSLRSRPHDLVVCRHPNRLPPTLHHTLLYEDLSQPVCHIAALPTVGFKSIIALLRSSSSISNH